MIVCFLSNISAKYYKNPSMLSRVIAKNVGDVFLRHSVESTCSNVCVRVLCVPASSADSDRVSSTAGCHLQERRTN